MKVPFASEEYCLTFFICHKEFNCWCRVYCGN